MKNFRVVLASFSFSFLFSFAQANTDFLILNYIDQFSDIAVQEMNRTGIPASITLAQGIIESGYGTSGLAKNSNNHFGIKCANGWTGGKYYYKDDDYKNGKLIKSCFRTYKNAEESYYDHSQFLMDNQRYHFLFDLPKTDYKSWAKGLKKAGYATAKHYATTLIKTIEKFELYKYDQNQENFEQLTFQPTKELIPPQAEKIADYIRFEPTANQPATTSDYSETLVAEAPPQSVRLPANYRAGDGLRAVEKGSFQEAVYGKSSKYLEAIMPQTFAQK